MTLRTVQEQLEELAKEYAHALQKGLGSQLVSVVLFGSVARGEGGPTSDIDLLLIIKDLPKGRFARKALLDEMDEQFWPR